MRYLCLNNELEGGDSDKELFGLVLSAKVKNYAAFELIWNSPHVWTMQDLIALTKVLIRLEETQCLKEMLKSPVTE